MAGLEQRKRGHFLVNVAGLVDGFVKNRAYKTHLIKKNQDAERYEAGKRISELMKTTKHLPKDAETNEHVARVIRDVWEEGKENENTNVCGNAEQLDIREKVLESKSCFRLMTRGLGGRKRHGAECGVKALDFSYGVTVVDKFVKSKLGVEVEAEEQTTQQASQGTVLPNTTETLNVPEARDLGLEGVKRRRHKKRRKEETVIPSAATKYTDGINRCYQTVSAEVADWKAKKQDNELKEQREMLELKMLMKRACLNTTTLNGIEMYNALERETESKRYESELAEARLKAQVIDANRGEKKLTEFIRRLQEGCFFYQTEQLFFEGFQQIFMKKLIPALAPSIVGKAWSAIGPRICRQYGWTINDLNKVVCANAPRRAGKSVAVAVIALAFTMAFTGPCETTIFSTCGRVSGFLHEKIKDILFESGFGEWLHRIGQEYIYLRDPEGIDDQVKKIFSYPSNPVIRIYSFLLFVIVCN